jgi:hypothetical protein
MAQAFGDAVGGVGKRTIQFWTDRGAIKCVAETNPGRGRQRLYGETEIPIARLIAQMAAFQLPIGRLISAGDLIRAFTNPRGHGTTTPKGPRGGFPASWFRAALAGKEESFICLRPPGIDSFMWTDRKKMNEMADINAVIVIPVHEVVKRGVSR